ncbi:hypothetical protein METH_07535 [Leisingera methylohalidivorans DSM 14336]|uniref:Uncharacterized protein n=1 Tax=Leisingera methylohalidivorans DSM 14336 TaxID=999552 RepID=V9VW46_9RHOB|nr:hypothetical protein METH_07535 [Leisingera methylohalidivorans DSM 14336]
MPPATPADPRCNVLGSNSRILLRAEKAVRAEGVVRTMLSVEFLQ